MKVPSQKIVVHSHVYFHSPLSLKYHFCRTIFSWPNLEIKAKLLEFCQKKRERNGEWNILHTACLLFLGKLIALWRRTAFNCPSNFWYLNKFAIFAATRVKHAKNVAQITSLRDGVEDKARMHVVFVELKKIGQF